jgi:hypothetical protein
MIGLHATPAKVTITALPMIGQKNAAERHGLQPAQLYMCYGQFVAENVNADPPPAKGQAHLNVSMPPQGGALLIRVDAGAVFRSDYYPAWLARDAWTFSHRKRLKKQAEKSRIVVVSAFPNWMARSLRTAFLAKKNRL